MNKTKITKKEGEKRKIRSAGREKFLKYENKKNNQL